MLFRHSSKTVENSGPAGTSASPDQQDGFRVQIRNLSGVPVLEVFGEINRVTVRVIEQTASQLARAGHYHLVLNLQSAVIANARALCPLSRLVREVRKHYGGVILVTRLEEVGQKISKDLRGLLRLCSSEAEALLRIKGVPAFTGRDRTDTTARLAD